MGLEDILDDIQKRKEENIDQISRETEDEIGKIIQAAKAEAASIAKDTKERAKEESSQIITKAVSRANIEGRMLFNKATNEKVEEAIKGVMNSVERYRKSDSYRKLLVTLSQKALNQLGPNSIVYSRKDDLEYLKRALPKVSIEPIDHDITGGVVVVSNDGRMEIDYSLENIIEDMKDSFASQMLKIIGGSDV